ncbi:MAG: methyltransferase domain-containing protein [Proteobacteria bacterium]|nr:methyltransferase domain-containing protein [Pseudomonadota bacterium]
MSKNNDQEEFWNADGGKRWVEDIDRLEAMLSGLRDKLIAYVAAKEGESALDVGCGGGITSAAIAAAVGTQGSVLGVDISEVILNVARTRYAKVANLRFATADAAQFPFEANQYDVITSRFGVMFFPEPDAAFSNLLRAAKSGARMVFICWRALAENPWMGAPAAAAFTILTPPEKPAPGTPGPFSLADPERVKQIMSAAGFVDINLSPIDEKLNLGKVDEALSFMTKLGPAAQPLREATDDQRRLAIAAMRAVLESNSTDGVVWMPGAVWLVEAIVP